jgi:O-glycosyl hydrolase
MVDDFAVYMCDILEHFAAEGLPFDYISPINEPQIAWDGPRQEGNRSDNEAIKRVIRALHAELEKRNLATQMAVIESANIRDLWRRNRRMSERYNAEFGNYLEVLAGDPEVRPMLDGRLSYHVYGNNRLGDGLVENRVRVAEEMQKYPDLDLWMSEYCVLSGPNGEPGTGRDYTMEYALWIARIMHVDLTLADATAWQWWIALSHYDHKDGLIYTDFVNEGDPQNIIIPKIFYTFAGYSRYVRPGMVRVELTGEGHDIEGLMGSAYKDEDGKKLVIVYVNVADEPQQVTLAIDPADQDWSLRTLTSYTTTDAEGDNLRPAPLDTAKLHCDIPARAVVTLVAEFE